MHRDDRIAAAALQGSRALVPRGLSPAGHRRVHPALHDGRGHPPAGLDPAFIDDSQRPQAQRGVGVWLAHRAEGGDLVRFCGFLGFTSEEPELIFALLERHAGQGFALEMARAAIAEARRYPGQLDLAGRCASHQPPPNYVRATPLAEPVKPPAVIAVPRPLPTAPSAGPAQAHPGSAPQREGCIDEWWSISEVIDQANRKAASGPDSDAYFNAIMTSDFTPGALYQTYAAPLRLTAIQFQPGEKVIGKPKDDDLLAQDKVLAEE